jgi:hypothetical protein
MLLAALIECGGDAKFAGLKLCEGIQNASSSSSDTTTTTTTTTAAAAGGAGGQSEKTSSKRRRRNKDTTADRLTARETYRREMQFVAETVKKKKKALIRIEDIYTFFARTHHNFIFIFSADCYLFIWCIYMVYFIRFINVSDSI